MLLMNESTSSNDPPLSMMSSMTSLKGLETLREGEVHNGLTSSVIVTKEKIENSSKEVH